MSRPLSIWRSSNSSYSNYELNSGYRILEGETTVVEIPLSPVPPDVKRTAGGGINEGAEDYAEMHKELWDKTREYLKTI